MSVLWIYPIAPSSAPRQCRADTWKPSPAVRRYRAYKDELKFLRVHIPQPFHHFVFLIPMPASWSAKKHAQMEGRPHEQKPDRDNLEKAVLDALLPESDCMIWNGSTSKVWAQMGALVVGDAHLHIPAQGIDPQVMARIYQAAKGWRLGNGPIASESIGRAILVETMHF